jgi:hypothetical protein
MVEKKKNTSVNMVPEEIFFFFLKKKEKMDHWDFVFDIPLVIIKILRRRF